MRLGGVAVAGFFPTPVGVRPLIAQQLTLATKGAFDTQGERYTYLDPCAGDGDAVLNLIQTLHGDQVPKARLYAVEMEKTRHKSLKERVDELFTPSDWRAKDNVLQGDAFKASWVLRAGVGLLWLNPPYDLDPQHGRLEEKFLTRFAPTLTSGGVLVFLVPFYALGTSAKTLAKMFDNISCFRFPDGEFDIYKQVTLFATKREVDLFEPDTSVERQILAWSEDATQIPVLSESCGTGYTIPHQRSYDEPFSDWKLKSVDFSALLAATSPWGVSDRSGKISQVSGILPEGAIEDLLVRRYPLAMPPRPAHIAAGIAAGVFNGARIIPDDVDSTLPAILVKGVFDKEFRTVEEKLDKNGEVKAIVQIQQPKLVTTVLDLSTSTYVTIKPTVDTVSSTSLTDMTMADLLGAYGRGLMDVMLRQCPVLHDGSRPEDNIPLPTLARPLYHAQAQASMAAIKLLGGLAASKKARQYKSAFVLGEIGSGKSSIALTVAEAIKAKRVLVMCPPHLLTSWQDQIKAVVPWFRTVTLSDVGDVQALVAMNDDVPTIALLSREAAKLGHAYESVQVCGGCGQRSPEGDHAKKRSHCEHRTLGPKNSFGNAVQDLVLDLFHVFPHREEVRQLVRREPFLKASGRWEMNEKRVQAMWDRMVSRGNLDKVVSMLLAEDEMTDTGLKLIEQFVVADPRPDFVLRVVRALYAKGTGTSLYSTPKHIGLARALLLLVSPEEAAECVAELRSLDEAAKLAAQNSYTYGGDPWVTWDRRQDHVWRGGPEIYEYDYSLLVKDGKKLFNKHEVGDRTRMLNAVLVAANYSLAWGPECGEPLYQAVPEPRRFPVATYICKVYPDLFDLFIADECHEFQNADSAQGQACHRITGLGVPTLALTGSVMSGYAASLFHNTWNLSADFRNEFDRSDHSRFVDRFGYRKRLLENKDKETGESVAYEYGSMSDRIVKSERIIGEAPGVLPLFILRYLLPISVTLHKTDLNIDIPKCSELVEVVDATPKVMSSFLSLQTALLAQIKRDRFDPILAGKLWGALAEMPSYLDLATEDTGNTEDGSFEIRYPDSVGGELVARASPLPASTILPKEQWMLDHVEASLAEGRNVLVFAWHTRLLPRLARLIEARTGEKCLILNPTKVPTKGRETWINKEVIGKHHRVLVVNPVTVQTGLNCLVYFADEIWMENCGCNPIIYRQAVGRVDRIGQKKQTKIVFPLYRDTAQQDLHSLLLHKVAVSMQTDGLDGESALQAAGVGESGFSSFAVGRQLYDMLTDTRKSKAA